MAEAIAPSRSSRTPLLRRDRLTWQPIPLNSAYSKMMGADEGGTLASLKAHRAALDPVILNHGGRIVKTTGDGLLLEFPSIVSAVNAAIEAQRLMASRNEQLPDDRRMRFRLGVHMGDVIVD